MKQNLYDSIAENGDYHGKILQGNYSEALKQYISENITRFKAFEKTLTPAILYLSAWQEEENAMWYEFAGKRFVDLMGCSSSEVPETFRKRILERRVYNYQEKQNGRITTQTLKQPEISDSRRGLRQEGEKKGLIEAVYKVLLPNNSIVWLKDQATVEAFKEDKIHISSGYLTIVTKEMEAEEELLKTQKILKKNAKALRVAKKIQDENATRLSSAIEQIEAAKKEAEKANEAKSEFLAVISHEIRNPMNGIIGTCDLIMADEFSRQPNEYLGIIKNSAISLLGLINDILDFSKIEAGKLEFQKIPFNLRDVIEDVSDIFLELMSKKNLELVVDIDPGVPLKLVSDPMRLRQVLINLASNALKFTEHVEIIIGVEPSYVKKSHTELLFHVKDTGIGIAPEHLDNVFDSFTQVNDPMNQEYGGTGLGLAICRQIVGMMGGSIWVESTPGKGSTFYFKAPFKYIKPEQEGRPHIQEVFNQYRVLIAEGNESSRKVLERLLKSWGFKVTLCSSGRQAIQEIDQRSASDKFELIIMDMGLEDLDNTDVINKLKSIVTPPSMIIAVSNMGREDGALRALEIGIDKCLPKPVKQSLLLKTIRDGFGYSAEADEMKNHAIPPGQRFSDTRILLVEDNAINRKIGSEMLRMAGIDVDTAQNGIEAVEKIQNTSYAAMLIDIQMPHLDGIEASRIIRQQFSRDQLPIIAMSAHAKSAKWEECLEAGINDYILKPISKDALFTVLKKQLVSGHGDLSPAPAMQDLGKTGTEHIDMEGFPGLDIREGIDRLGGDRDVFAGILKEFCKEYATFQDTLKHHVSNGDFKGAATVAHSLKGAAGNVSATRLFKKARALEQACWDQREDEIRKLLDPVQSAYYQVCESAERFFTHMKQEKNREKEEEPGAKTAVSTYDLLTLMQSLMNSLDKFDPVLSGSLVKEIEPLVDVTVKEEMDHLVHNVKNYQFDAAREILETLMKTIQKD